MSRHPRRYEISPSWLKIKSLYKCAKALLSANERWLKTTRQAAKIRDNFTCKAMLAVKLSFADGATRPYKFVKLYSQELRNRADYFEDIWAFYASIPNKENATNFEMAFVKSSRQPGTGFKSKTFTYPVSLTHYAYHAAQPNGQPIKKFTYKPNITTPQPFFQSFPILTDAGITPEDFAF